MTAENQSYPQGTWLMTQFWKLILKLMGWKTQGQYPVHPKSVLIFAPHTSNWDFVYMLLSIFSLGIKPNWLGKKELFFFPANYLFRALGGFPVNRSGSLNTVKATLKLFEDQDQLLLGLSPEGTRRRTDSWKTGFYHIANTAKVPINFCYLDYENKIGGVAEGFMPSGDIEKDMEIVRAFYQEKVKKAKYPHEVSEIQIKAKKSQPLGAK